MSYALQREHIYQERSINTWLEQMELAYDQWYDYDQSSENPYDENYVPADDIDHCAERYQYNARRVYNLCVAYFESKNLHVYLIKFDDAIKPYFADPKKMYEALDHDYEDESHCALAFEIRLYLNSFRPFGAQKHLDGLDCLESILRNTAVLFKAQSNGKKPKNEVAIYKAVKNLCMAAFPKAVDMGGAEPFHKMAKCYRPDILIPSLDSAVEYKYAKSEKGLSDLMDAILIDVQGYSNNPGYSMFYAVFYIEQGVLSMERTQEMWNEKNFPPNWKAIFVEGL